MSVLPQRLAVVVSKNHQKPRTTRTVSTINHLAPAEPIDPIEPVEPLLVEPSKLEGPYKNQYKSTIIAITTSRTS